MTAHLVDGSVQRGHTFRILLVHLCTYLEMGKTDGKNCRFLKSFGSPKKATGHFIMIFHWHECILPLFGVWISHTRSPKTYENIYKIHPVLRRKSCEKLVDLPGQFPPPHSRPATVSGPTCSFQTGEGE